MGVKQVIDTAATQYKGFEYVVIKGQLFDDKHPLVKGRPELFQEVVPDVAYVRGAPVEQATAAPGEKRNR
jgi:hypothetical protein